MPQEMLPIEWPGAPPGPVRANLDDTITELLEDRRLTKRHAASVAIAYTLADIMDTPGRATPRVLAAQQLTALMARLEELPAPPSEDGADTYEIVLVPVDAS